MKWKTIYEVRVSEFLPLLLLPTSLLRRAVFPFRPFAENSCSLSSSAGVLWDIPDSHLHKDITSPSISFSLPVNVDTSSLRPFPLPFRLSLLILTPFHSSLSRPPLSSPYQTYHCHQFRLPWLSILTFTRGWNLGSCHKVKC